MATPQYTGTLRKGKDPGTVVMVATDSLCGWSISFIGRIGPDGSYAMEGTLLGDVPPLVLDEVPAEAPKSLGGGRYWTEGGLVRDSRPDPHAGFTANGEKVR